MFFYFSTEGNKLDAASALHKFTKFHRALIDLNVTKIETKKQGSLREKDKKIISPK